MVPGVCRAPDDPGSICFISSGGMYLPCSPADRAVLYSITPNPSQPLPAPGVRRASSPPRRHPPTPAATCSRQVRPRLRHTRRAVTDRKTRGNIHPLGCPSPCPGAPCRSTRGAGPILASSSITCGGVVLLCDAATAATASGARCLRLGLPAFVLVKGAAQSFSRPPRPRAPVRIAARGDCAPPQPAA